MFGDAHDREQPGIAHTEVGEGCLPAMPRHPRRSARERERSSREGVDDLADESGRALHSEPRRRTAGLKEAHLLLLELDDTARDGVDVAGGLAVDAAHPRH